MGPAALTGRQQKSGRARDDDRGQHDPADDPMQPGYPGAHPSRQLDRREQQRQSAEDDVGSEGGVHPARPGRVVRRDLTAVRGQVLHRVQEVGQRGEHRDGERGQREPPDVRRRAGLGIPGRPFAATALAGTGMPVRVAPLPSGRHRANPGRVGRVSRCRRDPFRRTLATWRTRQSAGRGAEHDQREPGRAGNRSSCAGLRPRQTGTVAPDPVRRAHRTGHFGVRGASRNAGLACCRPARAPARPAQRTAGRGDRGLGTPPPLSVSGSDGRQHVEYDLVVTNTTATPATLTTVDVLTADGHLLLRLDGPALVAATQPLDGTSPTAEIPGSTAVAVVVDLGLAADQTAEQLTHRIGYDSPTPATAVRSRVPSWPLTGGQRSRWPRR